MARKRSMDRDLVAEVFKRVMLEIERPTPVSALDELPDADVELTRIDGFIERLLREAELSSASRPTALPVGLAAGTKPVSLRIPNSVINAFRAEAIKTGVSYQTLMIRALSDAAEGFAL